MSAFLLGEIGEVKIRTTNPQFFCQYEKVSFIAATHNFTIMEIVFANAKE